MAHIQRRTHASGTVTWRVRYIDPDGHERSRSFPRKTDAEKFATGTSHSLLAGTYIDPDAGQQLLRVYLNQWLTDQVHLRPRTRDNYRTRIDRLVDPHLGHMPIGRIRPSTIRSWQRKLLDAGYAPATVKGTRGILAGALNNAVHDRLILASPMVGVKAPAVPRDRIVPLTVTQVRVGQDAVHDRHDRYRAIIPTVAGTGMRAGETLGLTVDRVDFLRKTVRVDRQLVGTRRGVPVFGPPKTPSSSRTIPLPDTVLRELAAHLKKYPAQPGVGIWRDASGQERTVKHRGLIFTTLRHTPITRGVLGRAWAPARDAMGLEPGDGLHQLRHFYASLLIEKGRSVKEVQERLGHASAQETLDTYSHIWPSADQGTRDAIDAAFNDESGDTPKDAAAADE